VHKYNDTDADLELQLLVVWLSHFRPLHSDHDHCQYLIHLQSDRCPFHLDRAAELSTIDSPVHTCKQDVKCTFEWQLSVV